MKRISILFVLVFVALLHSATGQTFSELLSKRDTVGAIAIIKGGFDVNKPDNNGASLLMTACRWADDTSVGFLLRHGASPDKPRSAKGRTALIVACAYYSGKTICGLLIEKGADVNAVSNDGETALMYAAQNAKLDVVMLLLKKGANPKLKDKAGKTALEYAKGGEISEYLLKSMKDTRIDKQEVISILEAAKE